MTVRGVSFEEQLDWILSIAQEVGRAGSKLTRAERVHEGARRGQKAEPARVVRQARTDLANAEKRLKDARGMVLKRVTELETMAWFKDGDS